MSTFLRSPCLASWLLLVSAASACAQQTNVTSSRLLPIRESFDLSVPHLPAPVVMGGRPQLIYELHLTNLSRDTLQLQTLRVCGEKSPEPFLFPSRTGVDEKLQPARMETGPERVTATRSISPGSRSILYLEMESPRAYPMGRIRHEIVYTVKEATDVFTVNGGWFRLIPRHPLCWVRRYEVARGLQNTWRHGLVGTAGYYTR